MKSDGVRELPDSAILAHLESVLASPVFSLSHRSCQFLRYIVESSLADEKDLLKERVIGERIFGRPPDYDTGQDSIVRVKANEVRRRLAQYYDLHGDSQLRIDLPAGSYAPRFQATRLHETRLQDTSAPAPALPRVVEVVVPARKSRPLWIIGVAAMAVLAMFLGVRAARQPSLFARFWSPFLDGAQAPILCLPTPERFRISGENKGYLIEKLRPRPPGEPIGDLSVDRLQGVQILPETGVSLGMGDAHALTLLYAFAAGKGRAPSMRIGNETTFTELRGGPVILIGGFSNHWTMDLMKEARFTFDQDADGFCIRDRSTGKAVCRKPRPWEARSGEDCGVITRVSNSKTGYPLLIAAGLDHYGTLEAGEFLTRTAVLEHALQKAPREWAEKNLQIVYRIEVVRDNVGPPSVLATYVW